MRNLFKTLLVTLALFGGASSTAMASADTYEHQKDVAQEQSYLACMYQHYECTFVPIRLTNHLVTTFPYPGDDDPDGIYDVRNDRFEYKYTTECGEETYQIEVVAKFEKISFWPDSIRGHVWRELYDAHSEDSFGCYHNGGGGPSTN